MQQASTKEVPDYTRLSGKGDPLGIVQKIQIWPYYKLFIYKPKSGILKYKRITLVSNLRKKS